MAEPTPSSPPTSTTPTGQRRTGPTAGASARGATGSRTIAKALGVSRWRARKLMQAGQLVSTQPGSAKFRRAEIEDAIVPNQLNRAFQPTAPNRVWCGDITYIFMAGRWAYLAVVLDLYARRVVGWSVSSTPDTALVTQALRRAVETRQPEGGLLFHSDQGVQYRSRTYRHALLTAQMEQSMSRKGNCWDNAPMERLFRSLKTEWIPSRGYGPFQEVPRILASISWGITTRNICIAITITSRQRGKSISGNNLSQCPKILDHYTQ